MLIIIILLIIGVLFVTIDLGWTYNSCPDPQVIYKFVPRTFAENQDNPIPLDDILGKMFTEPTPWVAQFNKNIKIKKINDEFVSQSF
jgi:hypothetical protein